MMTDTASDAATDSPAISQDEKYDRGCAHDWIAGPVYSSTGPNIFGQIVTCYGADTHCPKCGSLSWRRYEVFPSTEQKQPE